MAFAADKAVNIAAAMAMIATERPDVDLEFLAARPLADAFAWLEQLLNAGTPAMPVLIVDTHVLRIPQRLGLAGRRADHRAASEAVTAAMSGWSADDSLLFHVAVKRLGQTICRWEMPLCGRRPLAAIARRPGLNPRPPRPGRAS